MRARTGLISLAFCMCLSTMAALRHKLLKNYSSDLTPPH